MESTTLERPDGQADQWAAAFEKYETARAEFDRLWQLYSQAEEALPARVDYYFDEYKLGIGMSANDVLRSVTYALSARTFGNGAGPKVGTDAYDTALKEMRTEASRVTDEFRSMAYQEHTKSERKRLRTEELFQAASRYGVKHYQPARDALMQTPAPDREALFVKMSIAATYADEPFVDATFADAKRLMEAA